MNKISYKEKSEAPFLMGSEYGVNFKMVVFTGEKYDDMPVFKVVRAVTECKVRIGISSKTLWGVVGLDEKTGESQWYNYNDCVSLENWEVLDRMLKERFGWMIRLAPDLAEEVKLKVRKLLEEE